MKKLFLVAVLGTALFGGAFVEKEVCIDGRAYFNGYDGEGGVIIIPLDKKCKINKKEK